MPGAVVLRPSIVFGPEDGFFNRFASLAKMTPGIMPVIAGDTRFQPVYVGDVAQAIVVALTEPAHAGKTFELGGPRAYSFRELIAYILDQIMAKRALVDVPMGIAKIQAAVLGLLPKPLVTSDQLKMLERDNVVGPNALTLSDLGVPATPVEAIAPRYLVRYRPRGAFSQKPPTGLEKQA
jgi:uncharacterized protein YbjT (DUF2867 family)